MDGHRTSLRTISCFVIFSYGEKNKPSFDLFKIISRKKKIASMLVCYQGPLCQNFIKIQLRDPEIRDPEKRDFAYLPTYKIKKCIFQFQKVYFWPQKCTQKSLKVY